MQTLLYICVFPCCSESFPHTLEKDRMPNMSRSNCIFPPWVSFSTWKCAHFGLELHLKKSQTASLGLKLTKISRSFKQSLQPAETSFCFFGAVLEIPGVEWNKESKWSLLIHPTCCPSRLRHEPCPLEEAEGKKDSAEFLSSWGLSLTKIQLLGHPNQRLPVTYYPSIRKYME